MLFWDAMGWNQALAGDASPNDPRQKCRAAIKLGQAQMELMNGVRCAAYSSSSSLRNNRSNPFSGWWFGTW
jgi:hypothetical protein